MRKVIMRKCVPAAYTVYCMQQWNAIWVCLKVKDPSLVLQGSLEFHLNSSKDQNGL